MKQKQSHTESTKVGRGWGKDVKNFLTIDLKSFLKLAEIDCLLYTNRPKSPSPHTHTHMDGANGKAGENGAASMKRK